MADDIKIPRHIAIIMDGNRRWAKRRLLPTGYGHKKGFDTFVSIADACGKMGVEYLTVYAFSTENWSRSAEEVDTLTGIIKDSVSSYIPKLTENNIRLRVLGEMHRFDKETQKALTDSMTASQNNTGLNVNICLSYGGRADITAAVNKLLASGKNEVTEKDITENLYTAGMPDPELMIRTGGEIRISNFLLWQCAYSEMYFTDELWPDFNADSLMDAVKWYSGRQRRFGGTEGETKK
ncbi:MAG: di-trans,poly-cis-decaprenylcistransferase [Ruminococcaceae bacterium]|nr:di-trans,poly-cis-decaprenylcistransferase [Oscillospiraceae bacterium]